MRKNDFDWFPLSSDYPTHARTLSLCDVIGETADAYPVRLMCWLREQESVDGRFPSEKAIERIARWTGPAMELVNALRAAGILDGLTYHGWTAKGGRSVEKMLNERARKSGTSAELPRNFQDKRKSKRKNENENEESEKEAVCEPPPPGSGINPDRTALHIAQRWVQVNPRIGNLASASQHFAAGLLTGIDPKRLLEAVEKHKGRKPWEIVDSMKPKLAAPKAEAPPQGRGDVTPSRSRKEIEEENAKAAEAERTPEAIAAREKMIEKLKSIGIGVKA